MSNTERTFLFGRKRPVTGYPTRSELARMSKIHTAKVAELNDLARTAMGVASQVFITPAIKELGYEAMSEIRERIELYDDFTEDNNPYGERDFGSFDYEGVTIFWKVDCYDKTMEYASPDAADPSVTTRVLTIMTASEY